MSNPIIIKIAPIGEATREVTVASGTTVQEALNIAGVTLNERSITLDNKEVSMSTTLTAGGTLFLMNKAKGGR